MKTFTILFLSFVICLQLFAQENEVEILIRPASFSTLKPKSDIAKKAGSIYSFGASFELHRYHGNAGLLVGLGFTKRGGKIEFTESGPFLPSLLENDAIAQGTKVKITYNQIQIPLGIIAKTVDYGFWRYRGSLVLVPSMNLGGSAELLGQKINASALVRNISISGRVSIGMEYTLSPESVVSLTIEYSPGITGVLRDFKVIQNSWSFITLGIAF